MKLDTRYGIEVFWNESGSISMQQLDTDDDGVVVVHPDDVDRLIDILKRTRDAGQES